jgi:hypothetical protein
MKPMTFRFMKVKEEDGNSVYYLQDATVNHDNADYMMDGRYIRNSYRYTEEETFAK